MKSVRFVALIGSVVMMFSGCGGSSTDASSSSVPEQSPRDRYVEVAQMEYPDVSGAALLTLGDEMCAALDRGESVESILLLGASQEIGAQGTGYLLAGATRELCPEHRSKVDALLD